jgi:competence protein ComEC
MFLKIEAPLLRISSHEGASLPYNIYFLRKYLFFFLGWVFFVSCSCDAVTEQSHVPIAAPLAPKGQNTLRVSFINVGHGDATLLELPNGQTMLVDAALEKAANDLLIPFLKNNLPKQRLDYLVLTHQHIDHIGGFYEILKNFPIGEVWTNGLTLNTNQEKMLQERNIPLKAPTLEQEILLGEVRFFIVNTFEASRCRSLFWSNDINECSLSMRVSLGDVSFLLPGDLMYKGTNFSAAHFGQKLQSTILKMPHHGIRQYQLGNFIDIVKPKVAVASASGRDPESDVLALYQERSIQTYATRDNGNITIETNGKSYQSVTSK